MEFQDILAIHPYHNRTWKVFMTAFCVRNELMNLSIWRSRQHWGIYV